MSERRSRLCLICGLVEVEASSICPACAEGVKREALGRQADLKRRAAQEMRRHGVNPEEAEPQELSER